MHVPIVCIRQDAYVPAITFWRPKHSHCLCITDIKAICKSCTVHVHITDYHPGLPTPMLSMTTLLRTWCGLGFVVLEPEGIACMSSENQIL